MVRHFRFVSLAAAGMLAAGLSAQDRPFRASVDVVTVDAVATDRHGNPVLDLKAADFEIRERGKVQAIDSFKLVVDDADDQDPASLRDIVSEEDLRRQAARDDVRVIGIFLDDYHVQRINSLAVRDKIAAFVKQISSRDLVAIIYPLTPISGLKFSRNREEQARVIEKFTGRKYNYAPQNAAEESYWFCSPAQIEGIRDGVSDSALRGVAAYLGSLTERRATMLFVSEGLHEQLPKRLAQRDQGCPRLLVSPSNGGSPLLWGTTLKGNTAIYTLDPRGLDSGDFDVRDSQEEAAAGRKRVARTQEFLRNLAFQTGGRAIVNTNNVDGLLRQILKDTGAYYLMTYTSTEAFRDGLFHQIDVRVKRRGVELHARQGYWARNGPTDVAEATAPAIPSPSFAVRNALAEPCDFSQRSWTRRAKWRKPRAWP